MRVFLWVWCKFMLMVTATSSEFETLAFFEMTPDLVCIASKPGFFKKVNQAVIDKLGYTEEELFAQPISNFIHPDDKEPTARERAKLLHGQPLVNFQNRYIAKNGKMVWLQWTSIYFPDKEVVFAIAKDVTERKQAEKEIEEKYRKFESLATHFKKSMESDRKYIAVELHDELAQLASIVKMDIDVIYQSTEGLPGPIRSRMEHASTVSGLLINAIRRISFSLGPNMLDDLGLNETLQWLCNEFSVLNGIGCSFESQWEESPIASDIKLDIFRICQEALRNVLHHEQATVIKVSIKDTGDHIRVLITDNGKGFESGSPHHARGLINIRELAASINGKLVIEQSPGEGTTISLSLSKPLSSVNNC
jgi:PAS domain S-box-containing protein